MRVAVMDRLRLRAGRREDDAERDGPEETDRIAASTPPLYPRLLAH